MTHAAGDQIQAASGSEAQTKYGDFQVLYLCFV